MKKDYANQIKDYHTQQEEKYKLYGLNRKDIDILHIHLCEIMPSVDVSSGQAEWTTGELDNFILTMLLLLKTNSIRKDKLPNRLKIGDLIRIWLELNHIDITKVRFNDLVVVLSNQLKNENI